ncbi:MAG TPA: N-acetyltransferase [Chloroflexota bacterium]|jgi:ribosomal protein S18 acetylase RimI-like enzyme|nr:N-acetyltransferase [Chloroflexota bacterium]
MPGLEILPYASERVEDIVRVYNRGIVGLPYCATLDGEYFARHIVRRFFFHPDGLLTAYRRGAPVGYAHATFAPSADRQGENREIGTITALFFPEAEAEVGQALVAAAERWVAAHGAGRMLGWGSGATGYPFYRGLLAGLEPALVEDHTAALAAFRRARYVPYVESYLLASRIDARPIEPAVQNPVETTLGPREFAKPWDVDSWRGHEPLVVRAYVDGDEAGALVFGLMPRLSAERGEGIGSIASLGVAEQFRRRGIASLLTMRALEHLRSVGARECLVACHRTNEAAIATYRKFGFRRAALMVGHEKQLA